jgi:hypothetical protein
MVTKVERQLRRKGNVQPAFNLGFSSSWKPNLKKEGVAQPKPFVPTKVEPPKAKVKAFMDFKGKSNTQPKHTHMLNVEQKGSFGKNTMKKFSYKGGDLENRIRNKKEVFRLVSINRYEFKFQ